MVNTWYTGLLLVVLNSDGKNLATTSLISVANNKIDSHLKGASTRITKTSPVNAPMTKMV